MQIKHNTILIILVTAFGLIQGGMFHFGFYSYNKPMIHVDTPLLDFGKVSEGARLTRSFRISNQGNATLVINKVVSGCGCIEIRLSNHVILPSCTEMLYVTVEGKNYSSGVNLYVFSNDSNNSVKQLKVKYSSNGRVQRETASIDLGTVQYTDLPITKEFNLLTKVDLSRPLPFLNEDNKYLKIEFSQNDFGESTSIRITIMPDSPLGEILADLCIPQEEGSRSLIRIVGTVKGDCYALPPALIFGPCQKNDSSIIHKVGFYARQNKQTNICNIVSWHFNKSIEEYVRVLEVDRENLFVEFDPGKFMGVWTNCSIIGYLAVSLAVPEDKHVLRMNVPIILMLKAKKVQDG